MMTDERLHEIAARAEKATPGPWVVSDDGTFEIEAEGGELLALALPMYRSPCDVEANAHLIAAAPYLLAEVKRLRGLLADKV